MRLSPYGDFANSIYHYSGTFSPAERWTGAAGEGGAMRESETLRGWEGALERWLGPFLSALGPEGQRRWAPVYLKGLTLPGERKSVEPLAARVAPGGTEQLHHFIGGPPRGTRAPQGRPGGE